MKKIIKRISIFALTTLLILIATVWFLAYKYENDLKAYVIAELKVNLTRDIELGIKRMDYNILSHFPNISVKIPDLRINSLTENNKSLAKIKEINLVFDVFSIIRGEFLLNQITLRDGEINIIYNKDGLSNYEIWKEPSNQEQGKSKFSIGKINFENIIFSYRDAIKKMDYRFHFNQLNVTPIQFQDSIVLTSNLKGNTILIEQSDFLWKQKIPIDGSFDLTIASKFTDFKYKGNFLDKHSYVNGRIDNTLEYDNWDIRFGIKKIGVANTVEILPNSLRSEVLNGIAGNIDFDGAIRGEKGQFKEPSLDIKFSVNSGSFNIGDKKINNIEGSGRYRQKKLSNIAKGSINFEHLSFGFGDSKFSGNFFIRDFNNPWVKTSIDADFNLEDIHEAFVKNQFKKLKGNVKVKAELEGNIKGFLNKEKSSVKGFKSKGTINFENVELLSSEFRQGLNFLKGDLTFNNKDLDIVALNGSVNNSHFEMTGRVSDFLATVLFEKPITFNANLKIDHLKVEEFIIAEGTSTSDSNYFFSIPKDIVLDVNLDLGDFSFRKFKAQKLKGAVLLKNERLTFRKLKFQSCSGNTEISGKIDAKFDNKVVFECSANLSNIDAKFAFVQLENFGQNVLLAKHVEGQVSANIYLLAETDKKLNFIKDKIYTKTKLRISKGELNEFGPLVELQDFMKKEFKMRFDLNNLKFETLENNIEIINKRIFIPEMAIRTKDINMDISGKHTFDQEIDYLFKIKHSEIFKASKQNKIEEKYGVIENEDRTATLPLKMTGDIDNPKFSYDLKEQRIIITQNIKKEYNTIKAAFKKEFLGDKENIKTKKMENDALNLERENVKFKVGGIDDTEEDEEYQEEF
jgi:hypothetical protein